MTVSEQDAQRRALVRTYYRQPLAFSDHIERHGGVTYVVTRVKFKGKVGVGARVRGRYSGAASTLAILNLHRKLDPADRAI